MIATPRILGLSVLALCSAGSVSAQGVVVRASGERQSTRILYTVGVERSAEIYLHYGSPVWREAYGKEIERKNAGHFRLGTGFWASLHANVDLVLGGKKVPSNIWYLGLHRSSEAAWTLTLMDASKVARSGQVSGSTRDVKPDLSVPMTLSKGQDLAKNLKIELEVDDAKVGHGRLRIWWGQYELATRFQAAVVEIKPVGEPKFAKLDPKRTVTTKSGLMYEELRPGIGRMPKPRDTVVVRYVGWGEDGKRFDSTFLRKQPFTFRVTDGVIAGWCEGIQKMKPGAVFRFRIPPELAYGERGAGSMIKPNATIEFWIELLSIK